eukprot:CAMPEP_0175082248 /NCGR_PEP_ID=MMETSP0052_2-20121109/26638_1 /TAXON_ID=51329 ORGANISM="Polytomella parva, Strain SAG 63-3" /NCGR_SAMPLE_ID=MMETSP0052_2 /ASSEMBLY_ACC=CAM_ASM_000194 /LENGTH=291 /DNA_ID=CAMNT_0016353399 /DNA_START=310 /DNA_END=1181 /DNA_ORIENTATION=-
MSGITPTSASAASESTTPSSPAATNPTFTPFEMSLPSNASASPFSSVLGSSSFSSSSSSSSLGSSSSSSSSSSLPSSLMKKKSKAKSDNAKASLSNTPSTIPVDSPKNDSSYFSYVSDSPSPPLTLPTPTDTPASSSSPSPQLPSSSSSSSSSPSSSSSSSSSSLLPGYRPPQTPRLDSLVRSNVRLFVWGRTDQGQLPYKIVPRACDVARHRHGHGTDGASDCTDEGTNSWSTRSPWVSGSNSGSETAISHMPSITDTSTTRVVKSSGPVPSLLATLPIPGIFSDETKRR